MVRRSARISAWVSQKIYVLLAILFVLFSVTLTAHAMLTVSNTGLSGDSNVTVDASGTLSIGTASSTGITIGKADVPLSVPGTLGVTQALSLGAASATAGQVIFNNPSNGFTTLLQSSPSQTSNLSFTLPSSTGTAGQSLLTDGNGTLYFGSSGSSSQWANGSNGSISYSGGDVLIGSTVLDPVNGVKTSALLDPNTFGGFRVTDSTGSAGNGVNINGGYVGNVIGAGVVAGTIGGGGAYNMANEILCSVGSGCSYSTIVGGYDNRIDSGYPSTIGGAHIYINSPTSNADGVHTWNNPQPAYIPNTNTSHDIAFGSYNSIFNSSYVTALGTGQTIGDTGNSEGAFAAGLNHDIHVGIASFALGDTNDVAGNHAAALGYKAQSEATGAFTFADSGPGGTGATLTNSTTNHWLARFLNGYDWYSGGANFSLFSDAVSGNNPIFYTYGYRTGVGQRYASIQVNTSGQAIFGAQQSAKLYSASGYDTVVGDSQDSIAVKATYGDLAFVKAANQHILTFSATNDISGAITISSATSATKTFSRAYAYPPVCTLTPTSNPTATGTWWVTTATTGVTANVSTSGTMTFNYVCVGNPN